MSEREKELITKAKNGDEKSFEVLMQENYQKIFRLAFRLLRNEEDAYDLTSDTFIRAYHNLKNFRGDSSFYTYLYRICLNQGINLLKKRKKMESIPVRQETPNASGPLEEHKNRRLKEAIEGALSHLSPRERAVFVMRQYEGFSSQEIADLLRMKEGTVKATYSHAIMKLRQLLREWL
jgi:RNA polymerase sigma-70 factor (ECF subfamily)